MAKMYEWKHLSEMVSREYVCGYCGASIASDRGYFGNLALSRQPNFFIYICHVCERPTFFDLDDTQTPGASFGGSVNDIPDKNVEALYDEARKCFSTNSYTSVVLACRKLLMHVAVAHGANPGQKFMYYVEYLSDQHFIPPGARDWVDHIRTKGNEANHEIVVMNREDASDLISFSEMLLKIVYEFPANVAKKKSL